MWCNAAAMNTMFNDGLSNSTSTSQTRFPGLYPRLLRFPPFFPHGRQHCRKRDARRSSVDARALEVFDASRAQPIESFGCIVPVIRNPAFGVAS